MFDSKVLSQIRQIKIYTRRLLSGMHVGDFSTAQKGTGFEFDQIRRYETGDDVRFIDWSSSARTGTLQMRQYLEERNRTVILAVDISQSTAFSSKQQLQSELIVQVAGVLALVADYGKDAVGLLLFSDVVELYIPPARGRLHVHRILQKLFEIKVRKKETKVSSALEHLMQKRCHDAIVILLSDFVDDTFATMLRVVSRSYDVIALRALDPVMKSIPAVGLVPMYDPETEDEVIIDSVCANKVLQKRLCEQDSLFKRLRVDVLDLEPDRDFMGMIVKFFRRRMMY